MPKDLFLNLKKDKQEKIINAGVKEFTNSGLENASIKNIVEEAKVARGSFYAYFEDKEDFLTFILNRMKKELKNFHLNNINSSEDIFDFVLKEFTERLNYEDKLKDDNCPSIIRLFKKLSETKTDREFLVKNMNKKTFQKDVLIKFNEKEIFNKLSENEKLYVLELLKDVGKSTFKKFLRKELNKQEAVKALEFKLNVIKNGLTD